MNLLALSALGALRRCRSSFQHDLRRYRGTERQLQARGFYLAAAEVLWRPLVPSSRKLHYDVGQHRQFELSTTTR